MNPLGLFLRTPIPLLLWRILSAFLYPLEPLGERTCFSQARGASSTWLSKFDIINATGDHRSSAAETRVAQRMHLAFDIVSQGSALPSHTSVCARAWVQELSCGAVAEVDMRHCATPTGCGKAYDRVTRCWSLL